MSASLKDLDHSTGTLAYEYHNTWINKTMKKHQIKHNQSRHQDTKTEVFNFRIGEHQHPFLQGEVDQ